MSDCPICGGRKHIYKNGILERCECLINQLIQNRLKEASVFMPYEEIRYDNLESIYPRVIPKSIEKAQSCSESLKSGQIPKFKNKNKSTLQPIPCFSGKEKGAREVLTANLLKDAIIGGFSIINTSISELITRCFDKNENLNLTTEFNKYDVLCVNIGNENTPNLAQKVLRDLIRLKSNSESFLFFSTFLTEDELKNKLERDLCKMVELEEIKFIIVEPV